MPIVERVQLALAHLREGVSLRGLARVRGIPATTLRDNVNPVLAALDQLVPVSPDGSTSEDFDDIIAWYAEHGGTLIVDGTELGQRRDLLERWLPVCWALTSFQQAWPR